MFKWKRAAAAAVAAVIALSGCSGGGGGSAGEGTGSGQERGGTLNWGVPVPVTTFAAADAQWARQSPYLQAVYDTILKAAPDGSIEPNLATEWEYNDDNTVLTLTLRDDVVFTDGEKLTADAAAKSLLAFKSGTSPNARNLALVQDVRAVDETTLEIVLSAPDPALLVYLTQNAGLVASPAADPASLASVPVGSGPYVFNEAETVVGNSYVFDRNEDYWNPDIQYYDELILRVYPDPSALASAVQGGQVNVADVLDPTTVAQMEAAGFTANKREPGWAGLLIGDREGKLVPALGDVRVRQAINFALDREALAATIAAGYATPTTQIFPTYSPSFDEELDSYYEYDLDKAKELMEEAGYADGFEMTMPRSSTTAAANFVLIADQLAQIGITVNYEDVQVSSLISDILSAKYPAAFFQLQQDPTDWQLVNFQVAAASPWNFFHVQDPTVEGLISTIQTGGEDEAAEAGAELNQYLVENAWNAPFYRPQNIFVSDANTKAEVQVGNAVPYLWSVQPK
ncbi:ABC transporter substrate-binding protein [Naasia sp. SYSU D00948]|uniref:ABC transporter substrate-binding protein n=1 Tax=Naasia sp. SYSU D00948 TaxID=2817379 RepID=UPI001B3098E4|nr:ABC transporter substrate-binding protein [Naasia sp. SYSU D00948]